MKKILKSFIALMMSISLLTACGEQDTSNNNSENSTSLGSTSSSTSTSVVSYVTIKYDANGGKFADGKATLEVETEKGKNTKEPETPKKEGYDFVGWSLEKNNSTLWNFQDVIDTNMTLYAFWKEEEKEYENDYIKAKNFVVWNNSEVFDVEEKLMIKYNSTQVDVTNARKYNLNTNITVTSGYRIVWYEDSAYSSVIGTQQAYLEYGDNIFFATIVNGSGQFICAYAINIYVRHDYTYTFYEYQPNYALGDMMGKYGEIKVVEDDIVSPLDIPNNGYTFKSWVTADNAQSYNFSSPVSSDLIIYATYEDVHLDFKVEGLRDVVFKPYSTSELNVLSSKKGNFFNGYWYDGVQYFDPNGQAIRPLPYSAIAELSIEYSIETPEFYFTFTEVSDGYSIKLKSLPQYDFIDIPSTYNGKEVVEISANAFSNFPDLISISIPETVLRIGQNAFEGCHKLKSLVVPNSVISIGNSAFKGCNSLENMTLPFVGSNLDGTENTHLGYLFGATTKADNAAYVPSSLKEITITGGTSIGRGAFKGCNFEKITLPFIGYKADITIGNSYLGFIFDSIRFDLSSDYVPNSLKEVIITGNITDVSYNAFYGCKSLISIVLPSSVTYIGYSAFYGCSSLTSIKIPNGVKTLGKNPFDGCDALQFNEYDNCYYLGDDINPYLILVKAKNSTIPEATIHKDTRFIVDNAFVECSNITEIVIPNNVLKIGEYAFNKCAKLEKVIFEEVSKIERIEKKAFSECSQLDYIVIPASVKYVGSLAFFWDSNLTIYCDTVIIRDWDMDWDHGVDHVYYHGQWSYVDGVPTPNN